MPPIANISAGREDPYAIATAQMVGQAAASIGNLIKGIIAHHKAKKQNEAINKFIEYTSLGYPTETAMMKSLPMINPYEQATGGAVGGQGALGMTKNPFSMMVDVPTGETQTTRKILDPATALTMINKETGGKYTNILTPLVAESMIRRHYQRPSATGAGRTVIGENGKVYRYDNEIGDYVPTDIIAKDKSAGKTPWYKNELTEDEVGEAAQVAAGLKPRAKTARKQVVKLKNGKIGIVDTETNSVTETNTEFDKAVETGQVVKGDDGYYHWIGKKSGEDKKLETQVPVDELGDELKQSQINMNKQKLEQSDKASELAQTRIDLNKQKLKGEEEVSDKADYEIFAQLVAEQPQQVLKKGIFNDTTIAGDEAYKGAMNNATMMGYTKDEFDKWWDRQAVLQSDRYSSRTKESEKENKAGQIPAGLEDYWDDMSDEEQQTAVEAVKQGISIVKIKALLK